MSAVPAERSARAESSASLSGDERLFGYGGKWRPRAIPGRPRDRSLSRVRRGLLEARGGEHRAEEPGLFGLRVRRLDPAQPAARAGRAAPLRRGSAAAPLRPDTLTPPK